MDPILAESLVLAAVNRNRRKALVDKYGERVVRAYEAAVERHPLERANYENVAHLLYRDGLDQGPPPFPDLDKIAERLKRTRKSQ